MRRSRSLQRAMIELEVSGDGPAVVRLARPPVNALDRALVDAIADGVDEAVRGGAPAIVVTGRGSCFSAGIDTKLAASATREQQAESILAINRMVDVLYSAPIPVVAALNGHALGGGLVVALACDVRVAASGAYKLALNEAAAGVPFPAGPLQVVSAELDPSVLRELCLTSRIVEPSEALALRLVDELCEPAALGERAAALAVELASQPAFGAVKRQLRAHVATALHRIAASGEDPMFERWLAG